MPHDEPNQGHWHEITDTSQKAGLGTFKRPPMPYDNFMVEEGIPIYRDYGVHKVQNLALKPWRRMGGKGAFIQLYGTEGLWGSYVVEVPGAGALNIERHMYEEQFLVVEGRGTTEVWQEGGEKRVFEWQKGSLFAIPLNAYHQIINASSSPALLLAGTSAPNVMNLFDSPGFIFDCGHTFAERFDGAADYFKPKDDLAPDPVRGLAMRETNLLPDIMTCQLPLDNRRSPGYRRIEPHMVSNRFYLWIGEHETGRYSKGHKHGSAAVLICVKGKGYTYTWPSELGPKPWESGLADKVVRVDYEPVGMVSAAPMSGDWYHQHFGISKEPLRLTAWFGPNNARGRKAGLPGVEEKDLGAIDIRDGGNAIPYDEEDPNIRAEYEATLAKEGAVPRMEEELYHPPTGEGGWATATFAGNTP
ncbi:MAG: cupin domain-containing protein [Alphaproteobacteria bacterium]|nr:cupin domain-containing protein [Pseudomonadota bacterium]TDI66898.1 MAG: cupin domain-containing protein [Alphaproteobacteria bacterium]